MKKKYYLLHIVPAVLVVGIFYLVNPPESSKPSVVERKPTSIPKVKYQPTGVMRPKRQMPSRPQPNHRVPASINYQISFDVERLIEVDSEIPLQGGDVLVSNIGAIPLKEWKPGMAPLVHKDKSFGYFKKAPSTRSAPVAYNSGVKKLYPISQVVHVRNVTPEMRATILQQGYQEYIYFPNIRKLSVRASDPVNVYNNLGQQGYSVKLEVLGERQEGH